MALRCTASASKRPEEVRKPQQGLAARFKLCGRKPLRGLPPSPRWTWRCALREANVRKGLGGYTRSSGTYLGPSGCANAHRNFVLVGGAGGDVGVVVRVVHRPRSGSLSDSGERETPGADQARRLTSSTEADWGGRSHGGPGH